jgi:hypothetical protein
MKRVVAGFLMRSQTAENVGLRKTGGESVSQSPLKDKAFSSFLD